MEACLYGSRVRLFLSLRPPAPVRAHLAAALAGTRTTDVAQWHATLVFLGEVPDAEPLVPGLESVAGSSPQLALRLEGGGEFRRTGAVWAGIDGDVAGLRRLAAALAEASRSAGVAVEERAFRPHLTVARRGRAPRALERYRGPAWTASEVELVRRHLGATARHEVLRAFPLAGGQPPAPPSGSASSTSSSSR